MIIILSIIGFYCTPLLQGSLKFSKPVVIGGDRAWLVFKLMVLERLGDVLQ